MAMEEPSPGQQCALQARKHIAALWRSRPGIAILIRWCPAHNGVESNEKADEWAKVAAEEPDTHGLEWLNYSDRTEVRPMSVPRSLVGAPTDIGRRPMNALAYAGATESTVLLEEPETLDAALLQEEEEEAKMEAEKARPGLTTYTDGSRMEDGVAGCAVVWNKGGSWAGIKTHMGYTTRRPTTRSVPPSRVHWNRVRVET